MVVYNNVKNDELRPTKISCNYHIKIFSKKGESDFVLRAIVWHQSPHNLQHFYFSRSEFATKK